MNKPTPAAARGRFPRKGATPTAGRSPIRGVCLERIAFRSPRVARSAVEQLT